MSRILKALLKTILAILLFTLIGFGFYIIPWIMIAIWSLIGIVAIFLGFYWED